LSLNNDENLFAMGNAKIITVGSIIAVGLVIPAILQYQANTGLKGKNELQRSQAAESPRPQAADQRLSDTEEELRRLRRDHAELVRLRGEVASLRQQISAMPTNMNITSRNEGSGDGQQIEPVTEAEVAEFLQRPANEQGKIFGGHERSTTIGSAVNDGVSA
jgi:hypothetical protein